MDRTIPPGIPGGEDAGAVVGVVGPDSMGRSNTTDSNRVNQGSKGRADTATSREAPVVRIGGLVVDLADVPVVRTGSVVGLGR